MGDEDIVGRALRLKLQEGQTLEFKSQTYSDAKEWLKDVTAFANADGGTILLGIGEDEDGRATLAVGIDAELDEEIQRLMNWLRAHSDPDVTGAVRLHGTVDDHGRKFIVVDIEESTRGPHRLELKSEKFGRQVYVRQGRDSIPLNMEQVRDLIAGIQRTPARIEAFIESRVARIARSNPFRDTLLQEFMAIHICPRRGFGDRRLVDWVLEQSDLRLGHNSEAWNSIRPNVLGAFAAVTDEGQEAYHQVFYNGSAELTYTNLLFNGGDDPRGIAIPAIRIRRWVDWQASHMITLMHRATGCPQFEVVPTFAGAAGYRLIWKVGSHGFPEQSRDTPAEDQFTLPSTVIRIGADGAALQEDLDAVHDLIWRAWGETKCRIPKPTPR